MKFNVIDGQAVVQVQLRLGEYGVLRRQSRIGQRRVLCLVECDLSNGGCGRAVVEHDLLLFF